MLSLLKPINQGGFGAVHLARELASNALVAVKVLHLPTQGHIRRFYRKAKILHAQMENP